MFFSLKPSLSQGKSSLKIQLIRFSRFGGVREETNKQDKLIHSLTSNCPYRVIVAALMANLHTHTIIPLLPYFYILTDHAAVHHPQGDIHRHQHHQHPQHRRRRPQPLEAALFQCIKAYLLQPYHS